MNKISAFIKKKRKETGLTQEDLSQKAGVGLRQVRDLEQEKGVSFRINTVNRILKLFGKTLGPVDLSKDDFD